ncbi:hypothetical protein FRC0418_02008 [Corynebacterium diphtheriae]|nr:hypothetical protein FRC0418_02008 [Corynebacterium diphtheriae]CAB0969216.1 hypothetical protein FRC0448_01979 [Corynebacterium diphtheriae]
MTLRRLLMAFQAARMWGSIGSTDSASITVTITVLCGAVDGIDDGISVRLHGRSLVLYGQNQGRLISCATPEPPAN